MSRRVLVGEVADIGAGEGRVVEAEGRTLALFNVDGAFYASTIHAPTAAGLSAREISTARWSCARGMLGAGT